ncbi:thioredoxin [Helicocarpus griseus UAMH5409]|uniref:Thioredoxin n=1 Tax=Helicocarpus griseus UAMH5409 TaxID=1447875 RepID=A0A2B7WZM0_9EURO|nr:thioredoxin [Helicocarpus griseus UAMH5409]
MFAPTSSRAVVHHIIHHHYHQPLLHSTSHNLSLLLYNPSTSSASSTVASLRPLLRASNFSTVTTSKRSNCPSLTTKKSVVTPLRQQQSSNFSSSARLAFRPTTATMVVHNLQDRTSFNNAVNTTTAAASGTKTPLIVIDCFATWCGPCKMIAPKLVEFSESYPNVGFYKVDVDECPDVAQELGVRAMPTFVFFKDGQKVDEVLGAVPPAIEAAIKKHAA